MSERTVTGPGSAGPSRSDVGITDASALLGGAVWIGATVWFDPGQIERALALAPLVVVPLGIGMAATPDFEGRAGGLHGVGVRLQPLGALLLVGSLLLPGGWRAAGLAVPWLLVTGVVGLAGAARSADRGLYPLSETLVDAGFAYANVGAVALLLYHLDITFWFSPVIVLLTAVHFHYAGFALLVTTGFVGRCGAVDGSTPFRLLGAVVLAGPAIIAVGISFSQTVELVGVALFTLAVAALAVYVLAVVVPTRPRAQGVVLGVSALTLPVSMLLALGFVVRTVVGVDPFGLTIARMVRLHGTLNAFGFALLAVVGWRLAVPAAPE